MVKAKVVQFDKNFADKFIFDESHVSTDGHETKVSLSQNLDNLTQLLDGSIDNRKGKASLSTYVLKGRENILKPDVDINDIAALGVALKQMNNVIIAIKGMSEKDFKKAFERVMESKSDLKDSMNLTNFHNTLSAIKKDFIDPDKLSKAENEMLDKIIDVTKGHMNAMSHVGAKNMSGFEKNNRG